LNRAEVDKVLRAGGEIGKGPLGWQRSGRRRAARSRRFGKRTIPPDMSLLAKARIYGRGFPLFPIDPIIQCQEQGADYIVRYLTPIRTTRTRTGTNLCRATKSPRQDLGATVLSITGMVRPRRFRDCRFPDMDRRDERKRLGFSVLIFLIVYTGLLFATKKTIWARAPGRMLNLICHRLASLQNQRV
jgi:hypothetical protein